MRHFYQKRTGLIWSEDMIQAIYEKRNYGLKKPLKDETLDEYIERLCKHDLEELPTEEAIKADLLEIIVSLEVPEEDREGLLEFCFDEIIDRFEIYGSLTRPNDYKSLVEDTARLYEIV